MREYPVKNGKKLKDRNYNFPDEVILDNLYFRAAASSRLHWTSRSAVRTCFNGPTPSSPSPIPQAARLLTALRSAMRTWSSSPSTRPKLEDDVFPYDNSRNDNPLGTHQSAPGVDRSNPATSADMDE